MSQSKQNPMTVREGEEMPCLSFEQMSAYVEKSLSQEDRAAVEVHLALCELCREAVEGMLAFSNMPQARALVAALDEEIAARTSPEAKPSFSPTLSERLHDWAASLRNGFEEIVSVFTSPKYNLRLAYVVATVFMLGFVSVLYFTRARQ
ncbi:zf-HC2 domain-containing protein [candidate division KSB1 bacterium]|nr:zf-HC2 domain-containing protein [candidate division KSB1 bacterium]